MKRIVALALCLCCWSASAANRMHLETGVGIEYGGIGSQVVFPSPLKNLEFYAAFGALKDSDKASNSFGAGVGGNLFLNKHLAVGLYGGIIDIKNQSNNDFKNEEKRQLGGAVGVKVYLSGQSKRGWVLGVTYNKSSDESFPFITLGYRF